LSTLYKTKIKMQLHGEKSKLEEKNLKTLIVRMTSKTADSGYYIAAIFASLSKEGETLSSGLAH